MTTALICGISGQDGAYLARFLLNLGYVVVGTSRTTGTAASGNLARLGVRDGLRIVTLAANDFRSVLAALQQHVPDEIYNLSGQSSVSVSFERPVETIESIAIATMNFLEAVRVINRPVRFYSAGSGECFGETGDEHATEASAFRPRSPYAAAKASAHELVAAYRAAYGMFACTGILFNHESPLRPERFVTRKIVGAAARIAAGSGERLRLGNLDIQRDWGWAPEYVDAMWRMLQQPVPDDFVIATGRTTSLTHFVERAFGNFRLDWRDHVDVDETFARASDIRSSRANPEKARRVLEWKSVMDVDGVIDEMCRSEERLVCPDAALSPVGNPG